MPNSTNSKIKEGSSGATVWTLENWKHCHKILAREADCLLNIDDVKLRFFFRPLQKTFCDSENGYTTTIDFYSLYVQIESIHKKVCLKVETCFDKNAGSGYFNQIENWIPTHITIKKEAYICAEKSAKSPLGNEVVEPDFFKFGSSCTNHRSGDISEVGSIDFDVKNNDLKISITATLCQCFQDVDMNTNAEGSKVEKNSMLNRIQRHLQNDTDNRFADFSLQMQDNVTLRAHRLILASASPVFEAMLTSGLQETQTGIVEIPDVSSQVMKILLEYMYTENVDPPSNELMIEGVLYAATKYQLGDLVDHYENALITMCTPANAINLLKLANKFNLSNAVVELEKYTDLHSMEIIMHQIKNA